MKQTLQLLAATSVLSLLSACGGGVPTTTNPGGGTTPTTPPAYESLKSTAAKTSTLGGVAWRSDGTVNGTKLVTTSGAINHDTGATTIADGIHTMNDPDGFDANGELGDGNAVVTPMDSVTSLYDYVGGYGQTYTSGGKIYESVGVGGVVTSRADVPTAGTANYTGIGAALAQDKYRRDYSVGTETNIAANFGAGTVDVNMSVITAYDQYDLPFNAPIDTISAKNMKISGNGFSGGSIATTSGGVAVNPTGANTISSAKGAFFGYDPAISAPDEVGGLIWILGDDGYINAVFFGD